MRKVQRLHWNQRKALERKRDIFEWSKDFARLDKNSKKSAVKFISTAGKIKVVSSNGLIEEVNLPRK